MQIEQAGGASLEPSRTPVSDCEKTGKLSGRRALILGGSGGIGRATAIALAHRGANIIVHGGTSREKLDSTLAAVKSIQEKCGKYGCPTPSAEGFLMRIERPEELIRFVPSLGTIDILACSFGPFGQMPLHETTLEDWERFALLDLALPGALASALLPGMLSREWGRIILFGGTRTEIPRAFKTNAAYAAAKCGLGVLAKSIAVEYAAVGIAAFVLCPGLVDTEYLSDKLRARLETKAPAGRLIDTAEIGELAASLAAMDPCVVSGAIINADAGLSF